MDDINQVEDRRQKLKAQAKMLELEKDLQRARDEYARLNKEKYSTTGGSGGDATAPSPRGGGGGGGRGTSAVVRPPGVGGRGGRGN